MVQKRPFTDKDLYEVSSKRPRQLQWSNQLVSVVDFVSSENAAQSPHTSGKVANCFTEIENEGDWKPRSDIVTELPKWTEEVIGCTDSGCISDLFLASTGTAKEDTTSAAPFQLLLSPDYCVPDRPIKTLVHCEEMYPCILEYMPRKLVSIGEDFQADIPEWSPCRTKNTSNCSDLSEKSNLFPQASEPDLRDGSSDENKIAGICVIPFPELESISYGSNLVGHGRASCCCQDEGSIRCVRQHIMEAREGLKRTLGHERFEELGFSDMGEAVMEKWTEEEEYLFRKVVFLNPSSMGKNFWDHLLVAFPSRTKKDIVSYYYNVFMLRRRAEQNRDDPMNVDSDNDEWQEGDDSDSDSDSDSDDDDDDDVEATEEDDDSVIESLLYHDDPGHFVIQGDDSYEYEEGFSHATSDNHKNVGFGDDEAIRNMSEACPFKLIHNCGSSATPNFPGKIVWDETGNYDIHDNLRTLSNAEAASQLTQLKSKGSKGWPSSFNGLSCGGGHEYVLEHCDSIWDIGYLTCPKHEFDFLPTCNMIEEVFGVKSWNCKTGDGKSSSSPCHQGADESSYE